MFLESESFCSNFELGGNVVLLSTNTHFGEIPFEFKGNIGYSHSLRTFKLGGVTLHLKEMSFCILRTFKFGGVTFEFGENVKVHSQKTHFGGIPFTFWRKCTLNF